MVHAKTCTIDGTWSTVGTANVDRLSLSGNYEINVEIIDPGLAASLEEIFRLDQSQLARAHQCRVGGARRLPAVHRVRAQPAAPVAVTRQGMQVGSGSGPVWLLF